MTAIASKTLLVPQTSEDEVFWNDYAVLTHVWGNVTGVLTMEPEGYLQYNLRQTLQEAETYRRAGTICCNRCGKQTTRRLEIDANGYCPACAQEARAVRESRLEGLRQRYPNASFLGHQA